MNVEKLKSMSNEELEKFIKGLSNRNTLKCIKCNNKTTKIVKINNVKTEQTKIICGLCNSCYDKMLESLNTTDVMWN